MALKDLFKKYGFKDYIYLRFNEETKKYEYFYHGTLLPYKKLDNEARKHLDESNKKLLNNPGLLEQELANRAREKRIKAREMKLEEMGYNDSSTEFLSDVPISPINPEFSKKLDTMLSEDNVLYGIHRSADTSKEYLLDTFENGLLMMGHGWFVDPKSVELCQNVGYYPDNMQIKNELINAHGFNGSMGSFLIRIPDEDLKRGDIFLETQNYYKRLKPKYIVGYVPLVKLPNGSLTIDRIITYGQLKQMMNEKVKNTNSYKIIETYPDDIELDENDNLTMRR